MSQLLQVFKRAETAELMGNWEEARQLYQHAQGLEPSNGEVEQRLAHLNRLEQRDADVQERIAEGDAQVQAGRYQAAASTYALAIEHAGDVGILKYHAELEEKRNRAREVARGQERVNEALQAVKRYGQQQNWKAASAEVDKALEHLPEQPAYRPLREKLLQTRQQIEQQLDDKALYEQARAAIEAKDYAQGIRLLEALPENSRYRNARLLQQLKQRWMSVKESLHHSEIALQEQRWEDAFSQLNTLRGQYAELPRWQALWLQAARGYGQHLLEQGRQYNANREFGLAQKHFEEAQQVFEQVLEVHSTHKSVLDLRDESLDLAAIVLLEKQAQGDWDAGRRAEALVALESAQRRIAHAKTDGRTYAAVEAVVNVMHQAVEREVAGLQTAHRALERGQGYLKKQQLERAKQSFIEAADTADALDPEIKHQAQQGMDDVEARLDQFARYMQSGAQATDPVPAAQAYRRAYELWPEGPNARSALLAALVQAGQTVGEAGRDTEAATYFKQALALDSDHPEAQDGLEKAGVRPEVESTLQETRAKFEMLRRGDELHAEDFKTLLDTLEATLLKVSDWEDLRAKLNTLHQEIHTQYQQVQRYEQLRQRAITRQTQGEWANAIEALDEALAALQDNVPLSMQQRRAQWVEILEALKAAREMGGAALAQAQEHYAAVTEEESLADMLVYLEETADVLARAGAPVRAAQELAREASGPLPADVRDLQTQVADLQAKVDVATDAAKTYSAREGLLKIREAVRLKGADPTLEALQTQLEAQVRDLIPELKAQMQTAMEAGNTTEALGLVRQIRELQPEDTEVAQLLNRLQRREKLEAQIQGAYQDSESKLNTNSLPDAVRALEKGLDAFLDPELEWPAEARRTLLQLKDLKRAKGESFDNAEVWGEIQQLLATLGHQGLESWVARKAYEMAERWLGLARDHVAQGMIASAERGEMLMRGFRAAYAHTMENPSDEEAIHRSSMIQEKLINQLNSSATKRISRAQEAIQQGEFENALQNLASLDSEIYGPAEREFPWLLKKYDKVDETRRQAERLLADAEKLQILDKDVRPKLEAAQQAFSEDDLDAAAQTLRGLRDPTPIPSLKTRVEELRHKIEEARQTHARQALEQLMNRVHTGLRLSTTPDQLAEYVKEMEALQSAINMGDINATEHEEYYQLLDKVRVLGQELIEGQRWAQAAEKAIAEARYIDAEQALKDALKVTRDAEKKIALQQRLNEVKTQAQEQHEREEARSQGKSLLYDHKYDLARTQLERAKELGADVDAMLNAARAGALWQKAQTFWQDGKWKIAQTTLRHATPLLQGNPYAEDISLEIEILQEELEEASSQARKTSEQKDKLAGFLADARRCLAGGDLEQAQAHVKAALEIEGTSPEALALQTQIGQHNEARAWVEKAQQAYQQEHFKEALGLVKTALRLVPGYPLAIHLKEQIEAERATQSDLVEVKVLANSEQFAKARARLHELSQQGVDPERLVEMQSEIERLEQAWWRKNITPIEEAQREHHYQVALEKCQEVMARLASEDYKAQLENRQQQIVNSWAEETLEKIQPRLQEDASESQLQEALSNLEQMLNLTPSPATMCLGRLQDAYKSAHTLRLRTYLRTARAHDKAGAYKNALAVVKRVREEMETANVAIDDLVLVFEIDDLERDIGDHQTAAERDKIEAQYQTLLTQARQLQKAPKHREDLEEVRRLADQMLGLQDFSDDPEAKRIQNWAERELEHFDATKRVLRESEDFVHQRRFGDAHYTIQGLVTVSELLKDAYDDQRDLIGVLRRAHSDQENEAWEAALEGYQQAFEMDDRLVSRLEGERTYVAKKFVEATELRVKTALRNAPPDTQSAYELVERLEAYAVIRKVFDHKLSDLKNHITGQECASEALELLQHKDTEAFENAQEALKKAQYLLQSDNMSETIPQWQTLIKALLAWSQGERHNAEQLYAQLTVPALDHPRALELREAISKANEVDSKIQEAQDKVQAALSAHPARYEQAIVALSGLADIESDGRVTDLQRKVITPLYDALEQARQTYDYARALEFRKWLKRIPELETILGKAQVDVIDQLPNERGTILEKSLDDVESALAEYTFSEAEKFLLRAKTINENDPRLPALQKRLNERRALVEDVVKPRLQEMHILAGNQQWHEAVDELRNVRSQAPNYPDVGVAIQELQDSLFAQAETSHKADNFDRALNQCAEALRLGDRGDLLALQSKVRADREAKLITLRQEVQNALNQWRLEHAQNALVQGKRISNTDQSLQQLELRLQQRSEQLPKLRRHLDTGLEELHHRDYLAAKVAFEDALAVAASFTEAESWRDYAELMNEAVKLIESSEDEYVQVARLLFDAEQSVRLVAQKPLPDIWESEDYLRELHRQAVYDAHRLRQVTHRMIENYRAYEQLYHQPDSNAISKAIEAYKEVEKEKRTFQVLHRTPASPPEDFPVFGQDSEAVPTSLLSNVKLSDTQTPPTQEALDQPEEIELEKDSALLDLDDDPHGPDRSPQSEEVKDLPEQQNQGGLLSFIKGLRKGSKKSTGEEANTESEPDLVDSDNHGLPVQSTHKPSPRSPSETAPTPDEAGLVDSTDSEDTPPEETESSSTSPQPEKPRRPNRRDTSLDNMQTSDSSPTFGSEGEEDKGSEGQEDEETATATDESYDDLNALFGFGQDTLPSYEDKE